MIAAPLVCGTLGEVYGWHYGFGAAAIGMLIGLVVYLAGRRDLPPDRIGAAEHPSAAGVPPARVERRMYGALALVFVLTTCFLTAAGQLGNVYSLWIKAHVDRHALGLTLPVTWFQLWTSLFGVAMTPFLIRFWQAQARRGREPALLSKMAIGLCCCAAGIAFLALLSLVAETRLVPWPLLLVTHLMTTLAYLYVWPVGLALFSAVAPPGRRAMFIGTFFLSSFVASNLVGWLGGLYATLPAASFWLIHAAIAGGGALLVPIAQRPLRPVLASAGAT